MGAIKYQDLFTFQDIEEIEDYKVKILELLEDEKKLSQAAELIENMIKNKGS